MNKYRYIFFFSIKKSECLNISFILNDIAKCSKI